MSAEDEIRRRWPQLAFALDDPEVGPILRDFYAHPEYSDAQFDAAIMGTTWYRTHSQSVRSYHALANADPATFWDQVQAKADQITDYAAQMGLDLTPEEIYEAAKAALYFGRSDADIKRSLAYNQKATISDRSAAQAGVKEMAARYFVTLTPQEIDEWTRKINSGQYTMANLQARMVGMAKSLYPHLAKQLDGGESMQDITGGYRQRIASLLEINPSSIDFVSDPRWKRVLDATDDKGMPQGRMMTDYELAQMVRSMPEFRPTRQARDSAAQFGEMFLREMGKVA